jgi:hypothetical protein
MRYSEFLDKLRAVKAEFVKAHGREPETVLELEEFASGRVVKPRTRGLRSLRGMSF